MRLVGHPSRPDRSKHADDCFHGVKAVAPHCVGRKTMTALVHLPPHRNLSEASGVGNDTATVTR
jgi:hypothetical protein